MEKYWYILYTMADAEKKVAASLARRNVEHFLPLSDKVKNNVSGSRLSKEPLFPGYVFVYISSSELTEVQEAVGALSIVHWKGKPAIVTAEEIEGIDNFISCHSQVQVIRTEVGIDGQRIADHQPPLVVSETVLTSVRPMKISLPSIGFILVATATGESDPNSLFNHLQHEQQAIATRSRSTIFSNS